MKMPSMFRLPILCCPAIVMPAVFAAMAIAAMLAAPQPVAAADDPAVVAPDTLGRYVVTRDLLLETGRGDRIKRFFVSEDRSRPAVTVDCGSKGYVWVEGLGDGERARNFVSLTFSPDGSRAAWLTAENSKKAAVFVDGEKIGEYDFILGEEVFFSPDGSRYGFMAVKLKKGSPDYFFAVIDGQPEQKWDFITGPEGGPYLYFSPDGSRHGYFAGDGDEHHAVIDGVAGPVFDMNAHMLVFSDDGQVAAYVGARGDDWYVVQDGELHGPYPEVTQPVISPAGHDIAYGVNGPNSGYMTLNHKVYGRHYHALAPIFSSDGERFAYWASDQATGNTFVVCDSIAGPGSYSVATPTFSAHDVLFYTSYLDSTGNRRVFYAEDRRLGEMTGIFDYQKFTTSADREHIGYSWRVDTENMPVIVDGVEYGGQSYATSVKFSPDGGRFAYSALVAGGWSVMIDGERGPVYGVVCTPPAFSPDGRDVAYRASQQEDHEVVVIGGFEGRAYEMVRPKAVEFEADGSLVYYGVEKRRKLYRVTLRPLEAE